MKLHLGCGNLNIDGFTNIDIQSTAADILADITDLSRFTDDSIEEIYTCHVMEHFKRRQILGVLEEWNRVLQPGGLLRISVPDFEQVVKIYTKNKDMSELCGFLNGGQRDDYDIHYINYDFIIMKELLECCGFVDVRRYDSFEFIPGLDDYSKCYIPHMDTTGTLMSLNVVCVKRDRKQLLTNKIKKLCKVD